MTRVDRVDRVDLVRLDTDGICSGELQSALQSICLWVSRKAKAVKSTQHNQSIAELWQLLAELALLPGCDNCCARCGPPTNISNSMGVTWCKNKRRSMMWHTSFGRRWSKEAIAVNLVAEPISALIFIWFISSNLPGPGGFLWCEMWNRKRLIVLACILRVFAMCFEHGKCHEVEEQEFGRHFFQGYLLYQNYSKLGASRITDRCLNPSVSRFWAHY